MDSPLFCTVATAAQSGATVRSWFNAPETACHVWCKLQNQASKQAKRQSMCGIIALPTGDTADCAIMKPVCVCWCRDISTVVCLRCVLWVSNASDDQLSLQCDFVLNFAEQAVV